MKRYTQEMLNEVIRLHGLWRKGASGGVRADLSDCDVSRLNMSRANLSDANLAYANLSRANMTCVNLEGANLSRANMTDVNLSDANMTGVNLSRANMTGVNLEGANLTGVNLSDANLWDCVGNSKEIKTMQTDGYTVTYTHDRIQIGWRNHSTEEWRNFSDEEITRLDGARALTFRKKWKSAIFQIIEMSPATATGHES